MRRNSSLDASPMEDDGEVDKDKDDTDLKGKGNKDEVVSDFLSRLLCFRIGGQRNSRGVQALDYSHKPTKKGGDSTRVEGCSIRDVVEYPTEDMVVCEFEERSNAVKMVKSANDRQGNPQNSTRAGYMRYLRA